MHKQLMAFLGLILGIFIFATAPQPVHAGTCRCASTTVSGCPSDSNSVDTEELCTQYCGEVAGCTGTFTTADQETIGGGGPSEGACMATCPSGYEAHGNCDDPNCDPNTGSCPEWVTCAPIAAASTGAPSQAIELPNPLGTTSVAVIIGRIIRVLTGGAGMIALMMFVYGGFQWLTAAGNPEKIKKGQDILLWSVLGLAVMFSAYLIVTYILQALIPSFSA